jgi:hypothetical protein
MECPQLMDEEYGHQVGANILNKQSRRADKGWPSGMSVGQGLTKPRRKTNNAMKYYTGSET